MDKTSKKKEISQMLAGLIAAVIFAVLKDTILPSAIMALGKMVFDMWRNRRK